MNVRTVLIALLVSVGVHAVLALALACYLRFAPEPDVLATLDLSSVELSLAEQVDDAAHVSPSLPSVAQPAPPRPNAPEAPTPPVDDRTPLPPDPAELAFAEPMAERPRMETPPRPKEERAERTPAEPQEASQAAPEVAPRQARVDAPPSPRRTIRPDYPRGARQRGEQGDVTLELRVDEEGAVGEAKVVVTSGFAELDEAALRAARAARFRPARTGDRPVSSVARIRLSFKLK